MRCHATSTRRNFRPAMRSILNTIFYILFFRQTQRSLKNPSAKQKSKPPSQHSSVSLAQRGDAFKLNSVKSGSTRHRPAKVSVQLGCALQAGSSRRDVKWTDFNKRQLSGINPCFQSRLERIPATWLLKDHRGNTQGERGREGR